MDITAIKKVAPQAQNNLHTGSANHRMLIFCYPTGAGKLVCLHGREDVKVEHIHALELEGVELLLRLDSTRPAQSLLTGVPGHLTRSV